jgi:hypothetical protein
MKEPDLISNMRETQHTTIEKLKQKPDLQTRTVSNSCNSNVENQPTEIGNIKFSFGNNQFSEKIKVLKCHNQIKELHTVLRDRETSHSDFKFYSDRLVCN